MKKPYIYPTIRNYLERGEDNLLKELRYVLHEADLAEALEQLTIQEIILLFGKLEPAYASKVLGKLKPDIQAKTVVALSDEVLSKIIDEMYADDRVDLIRNIPENRKDRLLHMLARAEREDILKLDSYEEGTAGAIMTSDYMQHCLWK